MRCARACLRCTWTCGMCDADREMNQGSCERLKKPHKGRFSGAEPSQSQGAVTLGAVAIVSRGTRRRRGCGGVSLPQCCERATLVELGHGSCLRSGFGRSLGRPRVVYHHFGLLARAVAGCERALAQRVCSRLVLCARCALRARAETRPGRNYIFIATFCNRGNGPDRPCVGQVWQIIYNSA